MSTLLIVDDSRTSRKMLREFVGGLDLFDNIVEAKDGQEGVEMFTLMHPDLVTLDITMPTLDGIGALKQIMELKREAKVIMVSASAQESKIVEALKLGAIDFISKPYEQKTVEDHLKAALKR